MSMYFLDAAELLADSAELSISDKLARQAKEVVQLLVAAYDALVPDWSQAPDVAQWYAICADGEGHWYVEQPKVDERRGKWISVWPHSSGGTVDIPLGIDWRTCKWQRPEAA